MNNNDKISSYAENALYMLKPILVTTAILLGTVQAKKFFTGNMISDVRPVEKDGLRGAIINDRDTLWDIKPVAFKNKQYR